jgi:hypothetical protein
MNKKSFRLLVSKILTLVVLFLAYNAPAQTEDTVDQGTWEKYKALLKAPCGRRDEAVKLGRRLIELLEKDELNKEIFEYLKKDIPAIEEQDKICQEADSLENLFENYKKARKSLCGERNEAVAYVKKILELYGDYQNDRTIIEYVKKDVQKKIEKEDPACDRANRYTLSFKRKDWLRFFAVTKEITDAEQNTSLALDVMLTAVSVGHEQTAYFNKDQYNIATADYAVRAIELIESGVSTKSCWGIFNCFKSKDKALAWLNYTIGYISYFRLKGGKKAIPFFYNAVKYDAEFKYDAFIYQAVAIHYFDREAVAPSNLTINEFIGKAVNTIDPNAGGTVEPEEGSAKRNELADLYKNLINLYNLRYNLEENETVIDLTDYIQKLITRPLLDPSAKIKGKRLADAKR